MRVRKYWLAAVLAAGTLAAYQAPARDGGDAATPGISPDWRQHRQERRQDMTPAQRRTFEQHRRQLRERWQNLSPEERARLREKFRHAAPEERRELWRREFPDADGNAGLNRKRAVPVYPAAAVVAHGGASPYIA